jgi:hypothetical protein
MGTKVGNTDDGSFASGQGRLQMLQAAYLHQPLQRSTLASQTYGIDHLTRVPPEEIAGHSLPLCQAQLLAEDTLQIGEELLAVNYVSFLVRRPLSSRAETERGRGRCD